MATYQFEHLPPPPGTAYGFVGPRYQGEKPGYVYWPYSDSYYIDPKAAKQLGQAQGYIAPDPKQQSMSDMVIPIGAAAGALYLGKGVGQYVTEKGLPSLFDLGSKANTVNTAIQTGAPSVATAATEGAVVPGVFEVGSPMYPGGALYPAAPEAAAAGGEGLFSLSGIGAEGNAILPIGGALLGYDALTHDRGHFGTAAEGAASGAMIGSYFGMPWAGAGIGGLIGLGKSFFEHESTRDVAKKHTGQLMSQGQNDPVWQQYVSGMRQQFNAGPPDPEHPYGDTKGNKFKTWDEYKQHGLDAANLTGVYGNLNTYGPDWAHYTPEQQQQITQANINSGLYDSKKGEVVINNEDQAKKNRDAVLAGTLKPQTAIGAQNNAIQTISPITTPVVQPQRTTTLSPGIGLDGKPINYGLIGLG